MSSIPFQHRKHWGAFAILMLLTVFGSLGSNIPLAFQIFSAVLVAPYVISIPLLYRVIMEYNPGSRMRRAWVLMMWCAGFSVLRHLLDFVSSLVNVRLGMQIRDISLGDVAVDSVCGVNPHVAIRAIDHFHGLAAV